MNENKPILLLCLDLEQGSSALVRYAAVLAGRCGQAVHLFYVEPPGGGSVIRDARKQMKTLAEKFLQGIDIEAVVQRRGVAEHEIITYAQQVAVDQIIIGRRQRSTVERIYVGSTTSAVLSLTSCPVLVVPLLNKEIRP
jgi:nucleotide-binding universal stress UspA family protein